MIPFRSQCHPQAPSVQYQRPAHLTPCDAESAVKGHAPGSLVRRDIASHQDVVPKPGGWTEEMHDKQRHGQCQCNGGEDFTERDLVFFLAATGVSIIFFPQKVNYFKSFRSIQYTSATRRPSRG